MVVVQQVQMNEQHAAGDDEENMSLVPLTKLHLPPLPPNQAPQSVQLSVLIDFSVHRVYHELTVLSELLKTKSDMDKKISIVQFAYATRLLFVRLLAVVKWIRTSAKVEACASICYFLDQQSAFFVDTADRLAAIARDELPNARLPAFQVPAAVDVLTLGSYPRLPLCIEKRFVREKALLPKQQAGLLQRLNQVIQHRLTISRQLPAAISGITIRNGMLTLRVPDEFCAKLTLLGELEVTPWCLLNVEILVNEYHIGDGTTLVHPLQLHYLHQLIQERLNTSARPLVDLYDVLHTFCRSLQLDLLYCQTMNLFHGRLRDSVAIESYVEGRRLVVAYWRNAKQSSAPQSRAQQQARRPAAGAQYKLSIEVEPSRPRDEMRVRHWPELDAADAVPSSVDVGRLSMERLLTETALARCRRRLRRLKAALSLAVGGAACRESGDALPEVRAPLFADTASCSDAKDKDDVCLVLAVNIFSGKLICRLTKSESSSLSSLREFESSVTSEQSSAPQLVALINNIRLEYMRNQCTQALVGLPVRLVAAKEARFFPLPPVAASAKSRSFCLQSTRDSSFLMRISLDFDAKNNVAVRSEFVSTYESKSTLLQPLDAADFDRKISPLITKARFSSCIESRKRVASNPAGGLEKRPRKAAAPMSVRQAVATIDQRLLFVGLVEQLRQRSIRCVLDADATGALFVGISCLDALRDEPCVQALFGRLHRCTLRLRATGAERAYWTLALVFAAAPPPLAAAAPVPPLVVSKDWAASVATVAAVADDLQQHVESVARLAHLVDAAAPSLELVGALGVKIESFNYTQLVLAYGADWANTATVQWRASDRRFRLNLARRGATAAANAHCLVAQYLETVLNSPGSGLPLLVHLLAHTAAPLACLTEWVRRQARVVAESARLNYSVALIGVSEASVRLTRAGTSCFEFLFLADGKVAARVVSPTPTAAARQCQLLDDSDELRDFLDRNCLDAQPTKQEAH